MDRRRKPAHPGDRCLIAPRHTPHMEGYVLAGMLRQLPENACADMRAGYREHCRDREFAANGEGA